MTNWIKGQQILSKEKIEPIELFENYVRKGLHPYSKAGRALLPQDLMAVIWDKMLNSADHGTTPIKSEDGENVVHISNSASLQHHIQRQQRRLENVDWADFELPDAEDEASAVLNELTSCLFKKNDVSGKPETKPEKKLRPEQLAKQKCRKLAKAFWEQNPDITIKAMSKKPELQKACDGAYTDQTRYRWINDLAFNRNPGVRPSKDKK